MVSSRGERQPPQNGGEGDNVDDRPWLGLIQLLCSALARLPPPGGVVPADHHNLRFARSLNLVCIKNKSICTLFVCGLTIVYTQFESCLHKEQNNLHIVRIWFTHCLHKVTMGFIVRARTCPPHSRGGNQAWHSHSPSAQTCHFHPSRPSSPGRGCHHHAKNELSCEESVPSSRYCTGVYLPNCPWFSCFLTHHSAGKQARQLHLSSCATWDLQNASTIKISANQSLCLMVHTCPKKFTKCKLI